MTHSPFLKRLLAAAVLACAALPCLAAAPDAMAQYPNCRKPDYPRESLRQLESGVSLIGFLIRADGTVGDAVVFSSSGSAPLDEAAQAALSKCVFRPATLDGKALETWVEVAYVWSISDDPGMKRAQHEAAVAAGKGDVNARYRLARILLAIAKTDADRERALIVMMSAAEQGHPHAQFEAGRLYEKGVDVDANTEEAMRWYQKSAAQGDKLALQRIRMGFL